jgi:hypothetical protein
MNTFLKAVDIYITLGRAESMTISQISSRISINEINWLNLMKYYDINDCNKYDRDSDRDIGIDRDNDRDSMVFDHVSLPNENEDGNSYFSNGNNNNKMKIDNINNNNYNGDDDDEIETYLDDDNNSIENNNNNNNQNKINNNTLQLNLNMKQRLFHAFMYWVFTDFINLLLGSCFYVTEGEGRGSEILFYRKPIWSKIVETGKKQMNKHFLPVFIDDGKKNKPGNKSVSISNSSISNVSKNPYQSSINIASNISNGLNNGILNNVSFNNSSLKSSNSTSIVLSRAMTTGSIDTSSTTPIINNNNNTISISNNNSINKNNLHPLKTSTNSITNSNKQLAFIQRLPKVKHISTYIYLII